MQKKKKTYSAVRKSINTRPTKKTGVVDKNFDKTQRLSRYGKVGK
jgi:hypothetical protein